METFEKFLSTVARYCTPADFTANQNKLKDLRTLGYKTFISLLKLGGEIAPSVEAAEKIFNLSKKTALTEEELVALSLEFRYINALIDTKYKKDMNATELRIGNWVYNEITRKKMQVYPMMIPQLANIEKTNPDHNIGGVRLTEEWLERFGLMLDEDNRIWSKVIALERVDFSFEIFQKGECFYYGGGEITYVHQLQNLCFALTGYEL